MSSGSNTACFLHFNDPSSLVATMKAETEVLKLMESISSVIFFYGFVKYFIFFRSW